MNKNLFRLAGAILTFEAVYIIVLFFPLIVRSLSPEPIYMIGAGLVVIGVLLMLVSGIGSLLAKKWAVITLWVSLILSFVVSFFIGHSYPSFVSGGFLSWVFDLIIAIFLTIEWKKSKTM
jgi:hypothetical protein